MTSLAFLALLGVVLGVLGRSAPGRAAPRGIVELVLAGIRELDRLDSGRRRRIDRYLDALASR
jgi:hypothetical protein